MCGVTLLPSTTWLAMEDSTGEEGDGKERGERVQSMAKPNITSEEQKQADKRTTPPLSSHHGDTAPPPEREQPLGSEHTPTPASVGDEYHGNLTEVAHYTGEAIPVQETVVVHSAATQELVTGGLGGVHHRKQQSCVRVTSTC